MKQQAFAVGNNPRVVLSRITGNVAVHPWHEYSIRVHIPDEYEESSTAQMYSEGDTVFIHDYTGSLELYVPYEKKLLTSITTDIIVTDLDGTITMERVGNVDITNSSGVVTLSHTEGNLRVVNAPRVIENKGVGGNAVLENISLIELDVIHAENVHVGSVGSAVRAKRIGAEFRCSAVGSSCEIRDSTNADVLLSNVGGSLYVESVARISSCNIGGSLTATANVSPNSSTNFTVGGNATLWLPRDADMRMRVMAGGSISGEAVNSKCGNMATLTYGNGSTSLNLTVGGSVKLSWATASTHPNVAEPYNVLGGRAPNSTQKREALLKMVEQGRITPAEGSVLLEALGE